MKICNCIKCKEKITFVEIFFRIMIIIVLLFQRTLKSLKSGNGLILSIIKLFDLKCPRCNSKNTLDIG